MPQQRAVIHKRMGGFCDLIKLLVYTIKTNSKMLIQTNHRL